MHRLIFGIYGFDLYIEQLANREMVGGRRTLFAIDQEACIAGRINRMILPVRTTAQKWKIRKYKILKKFLNMKLIYAMFPEVIDDWRSRQGSADYRNATPMMRQCMVKAVNEDLTELLPKIRQEVLLIWGDQDTATPIRDAHIMEEKIPNCGLAVIPGTGHFSFLEKPAQFRGIMEAYLK